MEHVTNHIFPPLAGIVNEYVNPQVLVIMSISFGYNDHWDTMEYSIVIDPKIAELIWKLQQWYPRSNIGINYNQRIDVPFEFIEIRIIDQPELVEAFERIYPLGEDYGNAKLFEGVINEIFKIYAWNLDPEDEDDLPPMTLNLGNFTDGPLKLPQEVPGFLDDIQIVIDYFNTHAPLVE